MRQTSTPYTDEEIMRSLAQAPSRTSNNPAVVREHNKLEIKVLTEVRKWYAANPIERVFHADMDLQDAMYNLLQFEGRHGMYQASKTMTGDRQ